MASAPAAAKTDDTPKDAKKVVRLLTDYWDAQGTRHSAAYVDDNGEFQTSGALVELPTEEARALVKTAAAERGDEY